MDLLNTPNLPRAELDLYSMWMGCRVREYSLDDTFSQLTTALMVLEHH